MPQSLSGRVAVVTGTSSGIGEAVVRLLAERGAAVAVLARRGDRLGTLASDIAKAGGTVLPVTADVTDQVSVENPAARVAQEF